LIDLTIKFTGALFVWLTCSNQVKSTKILMHDLVVDNTAAVFVGRLETPPRPSCCVPFRRDPDFVDRATLLEQIGERCSAPASLVALVGLGGVG
jgi:hypothetical protein